MFYKLNLITRQFMKLNYIDPTDIKPNQPIANLSRPKIPLISHLRKLNCILTTCNLYSPDHNHWTTF